MANNAVFSASGSGLTAPDRVVDLDFGTLTNTDSVNTEDDTLTIRYRVRVLNSTANVDGATRNNRVDFEWDNPNGNGTNNVRANAPNVTIREAELQISKEFLTTTVQRGDEVFVTLSFGHTGASNATAFDVVVTDTLQLGLNFVPASFTGACGVPFASGPTVTGNVVSASFDSIPVGLTCDIIFKVEVDNAIPECDTINNCGDIFWQSLHEPDELTLGSPPNNMIGVERTGNELFPGELNNYAADSCVGLNITNGLATDPVITGGSPVCSGGSTTLSIPAYTGQVVNYEWFGPGGVNLNNNSNQLTINPVTASDSGDYVVVVDIDGCVSDTSQAFVLSVVPAPVVAPTNDGMTCSPQGTNLNLMANPSGGSTPYTFSWTGPLGFVSNVENPVIPNVTSMHSGYYTVTVTDSNGCIAAAVSTLVNVTTQPNQPIVATNSPVCEGESVTISTSLYSGSSVTYNWIGPGVPAGTVSNGFTINPATTADAGNYQVQVTVDGCASDTSAIAVLVVNPLPGLPMPSANNACSGDTLTLTANPPAGGPFSFAWSGPGAFSSFAENPTIPNASSANNGTYTLTVTSAQGCTNQNTVQVNVGTSPATPTISSNSPLCEGETITLTTSAYSGATVQYIWTTPQGNDTTTVPQLIVSPASSLDSGNYSLVVIVDGCASLMSAVEIVDVFPNPTVTASNSGAACEGADIALTATPGGPGTFQYSWTGPNGFSSTQQNPTLTSVTTSDAGIYTVTISDASGNCTGTDTTAITVNSGPAAPSIAGSTPICDGDTLFLSTSSTCDNFLWVGPLGNSTSTLSNPLLNTSTNITAIPSTDSAYVAGNWSVICVDANGCESAPSNPVNIVINPVPDSVSVSSNSPVCEGETITLTAATVAGATYSWIGPNGFTSNQQNPTIFNASATDAGNYQVAITVNGCTSALSVAEAIVVNPAPSVTVANDTLLCSYGNTDITLMATVMGGTGPFTYSWTGPNGFASTSANPVVPNATSADAGPYTVMVTDSNGCAANPATGTLHITDGIATPVISQPATLCEGDQLVITATAYAGDTVFYFWNTPNGPDTTNGPSLVINPVALSDTGAYTLIVEVDGCQSQVSNTADVVILATPVAPAPTAVYGSGSFCAGDTLTLSATGDANYTYTWTGPNSFTATGQMVVIPNADPTYNG
ncbi:MAG: hypothetical protein AAF570_05805, partial [Bacteroidota bacterium]